MGRFRRPTGRGRPNVPEDRELPPTWSLSAQVHFFASVVTVTTLNPLRVRYLRASCSTSCSSGDPRQGLRNTSCTKAQKMHDGYGCRSPSWARTKNVNQSNSEKMRAAAEVQSEPPPPLSVARGVARRARLLVLEDEVSLARAILRWLRDYDAVHCVGLGEALKRIRAGERFDAVLCDVMMPGGNALTCTPPSSAKHRSSPNKRSS